MCKSRAVLIFLSDAYLNSDNCKREFVHAVSKLAPAPPPPPFVALGLGAWVLFGLGVRGLGRLFALGLWGLQIGGFGLGAWGLGVRA